MAIIIAGIAGFAIGTAISLVAAYDAVRGKEAQHKIERDRMKRDIVRLQTYVDAFSNAKQTETYLMTTDDMNPDYFQAF